MRGEPLGQRSDLGRGVPVSGQTRERTACVLGRGGGQGGCPSCLPRAVACSVCEMRAHTFSPALRDGAGRALLSGSLQGLRRRWGVALPQCFAPRSDTQAAGGSQFATKRLAVCSTAHVLWLHFCLPEMAARHTPNPPPRASCTHQSVHPPDATPLMQAAHPPPPSPLAGATTAGTATSAAPAWRTTPRRPGPACSARTTSECAPRFNVIGAGPWASSGGAGTIGTTPRRGQRRAPSAAPARPQPGKSPPSRPPSMASMTRSAAARQ